MIKKTRRSFTKAYKTEVVVLSGNSGKSVGTICRDLDLTETAIAQAAVLRFSRMIRG
jgi:transposase-like protein